MPRLDEIREMIDCIISNQDNLSSWEVDFVDNIDTLIQSNNILSSKQEQTLQNIFDKVSK